MEQKDIGRFDSIRLFIDCEFNGGKGQLISMALVSCAGHEFYEVLPLPEKIVPWVQENVIPKLGKDPITMEQFHEKLFAFLDGIPNPIIFADHPSDISYFADALITDNQGNSYKESWSAEFVNIDGAVSHNPHNALADAKALMAVYYPSMAEKKP